MRTLFRVLMLGLLVASCKFSPRPVPFMAVPLEATTCEDIVDIALPIASLQGTHLLYRGIARDGNVSLWVLAMDTGKIRKLDDYPPASQAIGFLSDGQHFVIIGHTEMWVGDINGAPPAKVSYNKRLLDNFQPYSRIWSDISTVGNPHPAQEANDYFLGRLHSPNNKTVAVWQPGDRSLVLVNQSSGLEKVVLATDSQDRVEGTWTRDSKSFIFTFNHGTPSSYYSQVLMVRSDGTGLQELTQRLAGSSLGSPVISPDNKKVIFRIAKGTNQSLGILALDNYGLRIYQPGISSSDFLYGDSIVWAPDSEWFAFKVEHSALAEEIRIAGIGTGKTYCVLQDPPIREIMMDWR